MSTPSKTKSLTVDEHRDWKPAANPWMIAASVMLATFMVVLDSSVANVALPHIAGNLSASTDESTWVLTSYLVANAIMLPASGWIARRIGRKRLLLFSILLFTAASLLCGMALNMPMLIVARVLQGVGGGGMQPLAQSILLESFPPRQHGTAMAVYGVGVIVAPVIGPTLGGWITDSYSWRWIFYINLPIGILALFMVNLYRRRPSLFAQGISRSHRLSGLRPDGALAGDVAVGAGQRAGGGLVRGSVDSMDDRRLGCTLVGFIFRELTDRDPIVQLRVFFNRNFAVGTLITCIYGFVLYGSYGNAAAISANHDGLFRAAERPLREPARPWRDGFDDDCGRSGPVHRWPPADGLRICTARASTWTLGNINLEIGMGSVVGPISSMALPWASSSFP